MEEHELLVGVESDWMEMSEPEAIRWLEQVDGTVFQNHNRIDPDSAWIAVVETPPGRGSLGKIILGFGSSLQQATSAAEAEWHQHWRSLSLVH